MLIPRVSCNLREAVIKANATAGTDTIMLGQQDLHTDAAQNMRIITGRSYFGPAILPDGLIFGLDEETSNVWTAETKGRF